MIKLAEEKFGLKDIMEEIDESFKPLGLVSLYIIWKNDYGIEDSKLKEELGTFIDSITPNMIKKMLEELTEQGLIKKDKDGNIILP